MIRFIQTIIVLVVGERGAHQFQCVDFLRAIGEWMSFQRNKSSAGPRPLEHNEWVKIVLARHLPPPSSANRASRRTIRRLFRASARRPPSPVSSRTRFASMSHRTIAMHRKYQRDRIQPRNVTPSHRNELADSDRRRGSAETQPRRCGPCTPISSGMCCCTCWPNLSRRCGLLNT